MKALVKFAKGREGMGIQDVPIPEPIEGEVRIAIKAAGICGSDLHSMLDERETIMPVTLGHEFVGVIDKVCGDVGDLKVGDWVTGLPACYGCGECKWCKSGQVTLCPERKSVGTHRNGAMAEFMVMPAKFCYKVPDEVEDKIPYAVAEPLACAVRGVFERIDVKPGDVAVVSGPGTIGLFTAQALKARGAYVIVSGLPIDRHRLDMALSIGVDKVVESYDELVAAIAEKNPDGADIVCEATGVAPSLDTCFKVIKTHGTLLQVGVYGKPITCDFNMIFHKELFVTSTNSTATSSWDITLDLINKKKVDLTPVVSLKLPLEDWQKGFDATIDKSAVKVLLIP